MAKRDVNQVKRDLKQLKWHKMTKETQNDKKDT